MDREIERLTRQSEARLRAARLNDMIIRTININL